MMPLGYWIMPLIVLKLVGTLQRFALVNKNIVMNLIYVHIVNKCATTVLCVIMLMFDQMSEQF